MNVTGNLTAQNYCNSTVCKDLNEWGGSSGAQYQFGNNNFNGSGNFTTTGNVNANTLTATGTGTFGTVKASSCYGSLGIKDCGSNYYTYIRQYYGTPYNTQDRVLYLHLQNADRYLSMYGNLAVTGSSTINQDVSNTSSPKFAGVNLGSNFSITSDANLKFITNKTGGAGIAWFSNNISAAGYMTRTSVYDKSEGSALSKIKDASEYLDGNGGIIHSKFYGYTTYPVTDYSKPVMVKSCANKTNDKGIEEEVCEDVATYPYTKPEEAVNLVEENALLHQAVFELKNCIANSEDMEELKACIGR